MLYFAQLVGRKVEGNLQVAYDVSKIYGLKGIEIMNIQRALNGLDALSWSDTLHH